MNAYLEVPHTHSQMAHATLTDIQASKRKRLMHIAECTVVPKHVFKQVISLTEVFKPKKHAQIHSDV